MFFTTENALEAQICHLWNLLILYFQFNKQTNKQQDILALHETNLSDFVVNTMERRKQERYKKVLRFESFFWGNRQVENDFIRKKINRTVGRYQTTTDVSAACVFCLILNFLS